MHDMRFRLERPCESIEIFIREIDYFNGTSVTLLAELNPSTTNFLISLKKSACGDNFAIPSAEKALY